tara:strand:- start:7498 stop:7692 length:195 start_codon:yes stop_codon:yes gene_type:complete
MSHANLCNLSVTVLLVVRECLGICTPESIFLRELSAQAVDICTLLLLLLLHEFVLDPRSTKADD